MWLVGLMLVLVTVALYWPATRCAFINYDDNTEYLVYAHGAPYPKALWSQIEELSLRINGGTDMLIAYDNNVRYPYWWYARNYANKIDFNDTPTRDVKNAIVIAVGDGNVSKLQPILRDNYYEYTAMRLWWPNMDYWSLKWEDIASERSLDLISKNAGTDTPRR